MTLTYRNGISIAEIVVYSPALLIAVLLAFRHGFGRIWYFLIIFSLARILGAAFQLATIANPTSVSDYTAAIVLQNVGFSPLLLIILALVTRVFKSITKTHQTIINMYIIYMIEGVTFLALILGIVGGVDAGNNYSKTGVYQPQALSKASTVLFIIAYITTAVATLLLSPSISHAEQGEKRVLLAVAVSLPFLLVRLVYSIMVTFTHLKVFNQITGNATVLLCVSLIPEFIITVITEATSLTLRVKSKEERKNNAAASRDPESLRHTHEMNNTKYHDSTSPSARDSPRKESGGVAKVGNFVKNYTIMGRIYTALKTKDHN
ncbi:hypothetical protein B7494_g1031 [Chlorociboria aeruginascens]|nr:hypothetical protein B7494_g1031 [Chlorociboria aeruginascens]